MIGYLWIDQLPVYLIRFFGVDFLCFIQLGIVVRKFVVDILRK